MRTPTAVFTIAFALGAITLPPRAGAQARDARGEGPTQIKKCQTIDKPGSYKLANDLTAIGTCLTITTGFVTIDLDGFSIRGNGTGTGILTPTAFGAITVRNGTISFFQNGVDLSSSAGSIVEGLHVSGGSNTNVGITATGIVKGNTVDGWELGCGISARELVTGNDVGVPSGPGLGSIGICVSDEGSAVIGNAIISGNIAIRVVCPSLVTGNAILGQIITSGEGCNITNNAP